MTVRFCVSESQKKLPKSGRSWAYHMQHSMTIHVMSELWNSNDADYVAARHIAGLLD